MLAFTLLNFIPLRVKAFVICIIVNQDHAYYVSRLSLVINDYHYEGHARIPSVIFQSDRATYLQISFYSFTRLSGLCNQWPARENLHPRSEKVHYFQCIS